MCPGNIGVQISVQLVGGRGKGGFSEEVALVVKAVPGCPLAVTREEGKPGESGREARRGRHLQRCTGAK